MANAFDGRVRVTATGSSFCGRVTVNWSTSIGGVNGISVERTNQSNGQLVQALPPIGAAVNPWTDTGPSCGVNYIYTVNVYHNGAWLDNGQSLWTATASCCRRHASSAFIQENNGTLDLLVPFQGSLNEFSHEASVTDEHLWKHFSILPHPAEPNTGGVSISLIQSDSGKLEAIVREGPIQPLIREEFDFLAAYESIPGSQWQGPVKVLADGGPITGVTGNPALIQTDYDDKGKFELLVPQGSSISYYIHENGTILEGKWMEVDRLSPPPEDLIVQFTAVSFVQSTAGMLDAVARAAPSLSVVGVDEMNGFLLAYELDPASQPLPNPEASSSAKWSAGVRLIADDGPIDHVTGSQAFIQSDYDEQVKFELLVPRTTRLDHYTLVGGNILEGQWTHASSLTPPDDDPEALFQAAWLIQSNTGALEAIARLKPSQVEKPQYLVGYEFIPASGWKGPVKLIANDGPIHGGPIHPLVDTNPSLDSDPSVDISPLEPLI